MVEKNKGNPAVLFDLSGLDWDDPEAMKAAGLKMAEALMGAVSVPDAPVKKD